MKIMFVIHSLSSGGAERVTATLANHWAANGHAVSVLTMTGTDDDFYPLSPGVERIALNLSGSKAGSGGSLGRLLRRVIRIRRHLRLRRPDVAIGMMTTAGCMLALAAMGTGIPTVGAERVHPPRSPLRRPWPWLRRRSYRYLSAVVAQTRKSAEWLRNNTRPSRVAVIPNPVVYPLPLASSDAGPDDYDLNRDDRHFMMGVGRLVKQKGFDRLLVAFKALAGDFPDWQLVILGDGTQRPDLEQQIDESGLNGRVIMPGAVGNVSDWFQAASLYVMPSRFEGFPNTLLEAMACGLPVLATDCETGPRDIISDGVDGVLVADGDAAALESAMRRLMADEYLRNSLARRATSVRERFAVDSVSDQWMQLFREISQPDPERRQ